MDKFDRKPYTKSLQDELDWKLLDQLHSVVAQISSFCFETKKFCVTTLFVALTLMTKFTSEQLDHSIFVAGLIIPICFWFLDATGYFYQAKLRATMDSICKRLAIDDSDPLSELNNRGGAEESNLKGCILDRVVGAGINHSMWLYVLLVSIDLIIWILYSCGNIK